MNASMLLIRKDGAVILKVKHIQVDHSVANRATDLGGIIKDSEEPIDTALRETNEQTGLKLTRTQVQFYRKCSYEDTDIYYFVATDIQEELLASQGSATYISISNKKGLEHAAISSPLKQVLSDYLDGFRSFIFLPDIDEKTKRQLLSTYYRRITRGKKPSVYSKPIALACTGLVASGKSSITFPLAEEIGAVTISSDRVREVFFQLGYNFKQIYTFDTKLIERVSQHKYNLFLDFNISTGVPVLDMLYAAGYQILVVYANPPYSFIEDKILTGKARQKAERQGEIMSYFQKDTFLYESMLRWKDNHIESLPRLEKKYGIWYEADTSRNDVKTIAKQMIAKFRDEF